MRVTLFRAAVSVGFGALTAHAAAQMPSFAEREAMYRLYLDVPSHVRGGSVEPHWLADGGSFWYAEGEPENTVIYRVDAERRVPFFDAARLRRALAGVLGHEPPYAGLPFKDMTLSEGERAASFSIEGKRFRVQLESYEVSPESASEALRQRSQPQVVRKGFRATQLDILEVPSPD